MNTTELRALQALILSTPACAPHVHTNTDPKIPGAEAYAKDVAIAGILSAGRVRLRSRLITERGVRAALPIVDAALLLRTLRELHEATEAPAWLATALTAAGVPEADHWAYHDALQSGHPWLHAEGIDLGNETVRAMLDLLATGVPELAGAAAALKSLGQEPSPITAEMVSRAVRGPWGDERQES